MGMGPVQVQVLSCFIFFYFYFFSSLALIPSVALLKFLIILKQGVLHFYFALHPANYAPGPA